MWGSTIRIHFFFSHWTLVRSVQLRVYRMRNVNIAAVLPSGAIFNRNNDYGTHLLVHSQTVIAFIKCLNRSLCGYRMCAAVCSPSVSHLSLPHSCCLRFYIMAIPDLTLYRGQRSEFRGSNLGCGEWHEAPLCEVQDQTASWVEEKRRGIRLLMNNFLFLHTYVFLY